MTRRARITKEAVRRWKRLGEIGEELALSLLAGNGFTNIRDLNRTENATATTTSGKTNSHFADFVADKDGERYVISVKARNEYEWTPGPDGRRRLNGRYRLGEHCRRLAESAAAQHG